MSTMSEAFEYLNKAYVLEVIDTLCYRFNLGLGDDRKQLVYVMMDENKLHFFSSFGNDEQITAEQAIAIASKAVYGVKNMAGSWVLSDVVWLDGLHPHQLDNTLQGLAVTTDGLEQLVNSADIQ